jgi:hypothetical protein
MADVLQTTLNPTTSIARTDASMTSAVLDIDEQNRDPLTSTKPSRQTPARLLRPVFTDGSDTERSVLTVDLIAPGCRDRCAECGVLGRAGGGMGGLSISGTEVRSARSGEGNC